MDCRKCGREMPENAAFCPWCGTEQAPKRKRHKRGNGEGSAYQLPNGKWRAKKVWGYIAGEDGKVREDKTTKSGFNTKKEAIEYLKTLTRKPKQIDAIATFREIYDLWLPTHERKGRGKSTINCYKAAVNYYKEIWHYPFTDIGIEDLQECIDECPCGKRTRENMKALGTLMYNYAIPRGYVPENLNYAHYLFVGGKPGDRRSELSQEHVRLIRDAVGKKKWADYAYCLIYTGFRPNEMLSLDVTQYDRENRCFIGGGKTDAGTNRIITISPKIQPIIDKLTDGKTSGPIFCRNDGTAMTGKCFREECFYPLLDGLGIDNPKDGPNGARRYTPYSCRHTFATLLKSVNAPDEDKLELMGHTSAEMLRHYQHVNLDDLRNITDQI